MSEDAIARFFDAVAARYDRAYAPPALESGRRMRKILGELPPAPARILDLGVGTGRELSALLDAGHRPTGLDVSQAMLARCARRARPVPLVHADFRIAPLPFDDCAFDAAVALHGTLAHADDNASINRLARELARVVRAAGRFIAEVPSIAWLDEAVAVPAGSDRRVTKTGDRTCVYEDVVAGVSIPARVFDETEWRSAFAPDWRVRIEPRDAYEWLILAERV
jgi:SAM-dependent methyltransferase